ncbi:MAG: hypothetical protein GY771_02865 [bacterium]|nr:hypothetical protein [bacterium]
MQPATAADLRPLCAESKGPVERRKENEREGQRQRVRWAEALDYAGVLLKHNPSGIVEE